MSFSNPSFDSSASRARCRWRPRHVASVLACALAVGLIGGCREDEPIRNYQVSKPLALVNARTLAVMAPRNDRTWFFKMSGAPAEIEKHRAEFMQFVESIHWTGEGAKPLTWKAPEAWQEQPAPGNEMRFAAFRVGPSDADLEATIVYLGPEASRLDNVNRWRGQIGLRPVLEEDLSSIIKEIRVDGAPAILVDLSGPKRAKKGPMGMPPDHPTAAPPAAPSRPVTYDIPAGWNEQPDSKGIALTTFQITDGRRTAEARVTRAGGSFRANVDRWRGQIGLDPATPEQLARDTKTVTVAGATAQYVDMTGSDKAGGQRILAVVLPRGEQSWFFTLKGPADLVAKQKETFEKFLRSVRFDEGAGGKP